MCRCKWSENVYFHGLQYHNVRRKVWVEWRKVSFVAHNIKIKGNLHTYIHNMYLRHETQRPLIMMHTSKSEVRRIDWHHWLMPPLAPLPDRCARVNCWSPSDMHGCLRGEDICTLGFKVLERWTRYRLHYALLVCCSMKESRSKQCVHCISILEYKYTMCTNTLLY